MIVDSFLKVLIWVLGVIDAALPTISIFPAGLTSAISSMLMYVWGFDWLFPVGALVTTLVLVALIKFVQFGLMVFLGLLQLLRMFR